MTLSLQFLSIASRKSILCVLKEDKTIVVKSTDQSKSGNLGFSSSGVKKSGEDSGLASTVTTVFESSRELVPQSYAGNATHTIEIDTAHDR